MYSIILHATDLSENHFHMCKQAMQIAKKFDATLYLLHVIETPSSLQIAQGLGFAEIDNPKQLQDDAKSVLAVVGESFRIPAKHQFVDVGSIKQQILTRTQEFECDLLIIGKHTPTNIPSALGNTAHAIIREAACDVLTLRV